MVRESREIPDRASYHLVSLDMFGYLRISFGMFRYLQVSDICRHLQISVEISLQQGYGTADTEYGCGLIVIDFV